MLTVWKIDRRYHWETIWQELHQKKISFKFSKNEILSLPDSMEFQNKQNGVNRNKDTRAFKNHLYKSNLIKENLKRKGKAKISIFTRTSTTGSTISLERKMEETSHRKLISDTTNKLIAMISQIASRLEHIENNIGILPNRF